MNRFGVAFCLAFMAMFAVSASRAADIFDQLMSPGQLSKQHEKLETNCQTCHVKFDKKKQSKLCRDCHKAIDANIVRGTGFHGKDARARNATCNQCHAEHKGRNAPLTFFDRDNFNHELTDYPLKGGHKKVACGSCHKQGVKYSAAPKACFECHRADDHHRGQLGTNCASCHNDAAWKPAKFDHNSTHFALTGKHAQTACQSCHPDEHYKKTPTDCFSCHKLDDKHRGTYGTRCESCHTTIKWATLSFDHNKQTKFPLLGRHAAVSCNACHTGGGAPRKVPMTCISCHKKDDVHKGQEGQSCEKCHNEVAWNAKVKFDHGLTRFPLVGLHATTHCEECHLTAAYKDAPLECGACHKKDDKHNGTLGPRCGDCHNPNGWSLWRFDHDKQTKFPLTGRHVDLVCSACHTSKSDGKATASSDCVSCHRSDDVHHGDFGERCEVCHTTESFSALRKR